MELLGQRYRLLEEIGRGGVAVVHRATDTLTNRTVALKCLKANQNADRFALALELFEREFHALSQLSHPRVVEVYAYHVDVRGAFYAMEILDGRDLRSLSPMDPERACVLMRDVSSALCLIHSRRLVHRDISPRNIHCTRAGVGKLIDFGAMSPMDMAAPAVGTPPFCAPEVVDMQPLDGRADLFSLGTSLYFALTGRQAYPARTFRELRQVWQEPPPPPSHFRAAVPPALDNLVMELIQPDRRERPAHAAEVMERLSAIAGVPLDEQLMVSQAYLNTPSLVGRERRLEQMRRVFRQLKNGTGSSVLVEGEAGVGRTRFINACALEAQLLGVTVARISGAGLANDHEGVVALGRQLLDAHPARARELLTPHAAVLAPLIPDLADHETREQALLADGAPNARRSEVQRAFKQWMIDVSRHRPVALLIDDFEGVDEPSATLMVQLAHEAGCHPIAIITCSRLNCGRQAPQARSLLAELSTRVPLGRLSPGQTRMLLTSIFGDVPNLRLVAARLHHLTAGNPRDIMELARHLVDRGLARYHGGSWALPIAIDPAELPESFTHSLRERVAKVGAQAKEVAQAFALAPDFEWSVEHAARVAGLGRGGQLLSALDELVASDVVQLNGSRYALSRAAWVGPLLESLDARAQAALHGRLADLFSDLELAAYAARHLLAAGEHQRALGLMVEHARRTKRSTDEDVRFWRRFASELPSDYCEVARQAVVLCEHLERPEADRYALRARLTGVLVFNAKNPSTEMLALLAQCERDVGLDIYAQLSGSGLDPAARLQEMFARSQARYAALPESQRVFSPTEALRPLVAALLECVGVVSNSLDRETWERLPSLSPLVGLSPSFAVMEQVRVAAGERLAGRYRSARHGYDLAVERLEESDKAGLPESYWLALYNGVLFARALVDVLHGSHAILQAAEGLRADRGGLGAIRLRKLHCLWQGDGKGADRLGHESELVRLETRAALHHEGGLMFAEVWALACSDDLGRLRRIMPQLERWKQRSRCWDPVLSFARGQQCRIRGELATALEHAREGLKLASCGGHPLWPALAGMEVGCLLGEGRCGEAVTAGRRYQQAARAQAIDYGAAFIDMPLSLALVQADAYDDARDLARATVQGMLEHGTAGVLLGLAHHNLARACLAIGDHEGFESAASKCSELFEHSSNQALSTKYRRLIRAARKAQRAARDGVSSGERQLETDDAETYMTTMFDSCGSVDERALVAGRLLAECCSAEQVFVYLPEPEGARLGASVGYYEPPPQLGSLVGDYLEAVLAEGQDATITCGADDDLVDTGAPLLVGEEGSRYHPLVLAHPDGDRFVVTAVAVVPLKPDIAFVRPSRVATQLSRLGLGQRRTA